MGGRDYRDVPVGLKTTEGILFQNTSNRPMKVLDIDDRLGDGFSMSFDDESEIPPGAHLLVEVAFEPNHEGDFDGSALLTTNVGCLRIVVHGIGTCASSERCDANAPPVVMARISPERPSTVDDIDLTVSAVDDGPVTISVRRLVESPNGRDVRAPRGGAALSARRRRAERSEGTESRAAATPKGR